jgi:hypothetical protein
MNPQFVKSAMVVTESCQSTGFVLVAPVAIAMGRDFNQRDFNKIEF